MEMTRLAKVGRLRMHAVALMTIGVLAGCASKSTGPTTPPPTNPSGGEVGVLTPEEWERLDTMIRQKIRVVNFCYDEELKKLKDRKFYGAVTLNIHIVPTGPSAHASEVQTKESTFPTDTPAFAESAANVHACLAKTIQTWEFADISADGWFLYTFHFEPQY
jgi:hypothetical protein